MRKILIVAMLILTLTGCASTRRQTYAENNTWLSAEDRQRILDGKIWVGMTKDQLFASWGAAYPLVRSTYSTCYKYSSGYVYTQGGRVAYWSLISY